MDLTSDTAIPIKLQVTIEPDLPTIVPDVVSFETGARLIDIQTTSLFCYEHHGSDFNIQSRGALTAFFEDLILGRNLPLVFATPIVRDIDTVMAITLFLRRDVALHSAMPGIVSSIEFAHRMGLPGWAHVDPDLGRLIQLIRGYGLQEGLSRQEAGDRLALSIGWLSDYVLEGKVPHVGESPDIEVLDTGTNGFVVAETKGSVLEAWVEIFRLGFLRGVLFGPIVAIARKSFFVELDLIKASHILNELERTCGGVGQWSPELHFLFGPEGGTVLTRQAIIDVLVRI